MLNWSCSATYGSEDSESIAHEWYYGQRQARISDFKKFVSLFSVLDCLWHVSWQKSGTIGRWGTELKLSSGCSIFDKLLLAKLGCEFFSFCRRKQICRRSLSKSQRRNPRLGRPSRSTAWDRLNARLYAKDGKGQCHLYPLSWVLTWTGSRSIYFSMKYRLDFAWLLLMSSMTLWRTFTSFTEKGWTSFWAFLERSK